MASEFNTRLQQILQHYNLSASAFASTIGVQRSSMSHILSGRNKPSLDFVMKVLKNFTEVEINWLVDGNGSFPKKSNTNISPSTPPIKQEEKNTREELELFSNIEEEKETKQNLPTTASKEIINHSRKSIDKIVIFYTDGTFSDYTKSN